MERIPIKFRVEEAAPVIFDRYTNWFCVSLTVLPEDGGFKYAVMAQRIDGYNKDNKTGKAASRDHDEHASPYKSDHAR